MNKIKLALIGAGNMANNVHYPSLREFKDVEMAGLCDLDAKKLEETARKFNIAKTYSDYKIMLEEIKPEAVYILMPPHHLFDIAIYCLKKKLHLFIEKPPAVTTDQTRELAILAGKNSCLTMVGFQRRHIPLAKKLREEVEKRGPIIQCVATFYKNYIDQGPYYDGAIDILRCDAIHAVDSLRWMAGEVKAVASDVRSLHATYTNSYNALLRFESGACGILLTNWVAGRRFFTLEMHARGISAFIDPDDKGYLYKDGKAEGEVFDTKAVAGSKELFKYSGFYDENRHFIDCLKKKIEPMTNLEDALKTMELADKIYQSQI